MKYVIQGFAILVLLAVGLWVMWPSADPARTGDTDKGLTASANLPGADIAPPDPSKPVDTMDPALRAKLLAALAARVAQAQAQRATAPDATASEPPPPRSPEWKRELKGFLKSSSRELQPLVLGCVSTALKKNPDLGSSGGSVKLHLQGSPGLGTVVSQVELVGPQGAIDAPELRSCIEEKSFFMRMSATAPAGTDEGGPTVLGFPLMIPGR
ncbi:MAG: hypothetical protein ABIJ09_09535 [Pseudomonadota bacterium]